MEHQFPSFSIFIPTLLLISIAIILRRKKRPTITPPGPRKLPLIGNLHQLATSSSPHRTLFNLSEKHGPIMHLQLGQVQNIVISSPEAAKQILKHHDTNFDRPRLLAAQYTTYNYTDIALSPYGDYWRQLRKICTIELFTAKRVQSFSGIRADEVSNLIKSINSKSGSTVNLSKMLYKLTNDITARAAFGGRCKESEAFIEAAKRMVELGSGLGIADFFPSIKLFEVISGSKFANERQAKEVDRILDGIIREHRVRKIGDGEGEGEAQDLLDVLLNVSEKENLQVPLTLDNIKAVIMDIFIAGTETSSTTTLWALSEMLKNSEVMKKAQEEVRSIFAEKQTVQEEGLNELKYLNMVIKETLRLHPPAPLLMPRECRESC